MAEAAWELVDVSLWNSEVEMLSRYFFVDSTGLLTAADLNTSYQANALSPLCGIQSTECVHHSVRIRPAYPAVGLTVSFPINPAVGGSKTGNAAPPFATISMQIVPGATVTPTGSPVSNYIKRGGKHIGGLPISYFDGQGVYNGTADDEVANYWASFADMLADGFQYVIARTNNTGLLLAQAPASSYVINAVGTQTTRKVGRGA